MAVIKLLTGTTQDYKAVEDVLILDMNEIAVEITEDSQGIQYYNMRKGDGKSTFFNLPIIVNNQRYEELNKNMAQYYDTVREFSNNMVSAAGQANNAAEAANAAAIAATGAADKINDLTAGFNAVTDDVTGESYTIGVESGLIYIDDGKVDNIETE